MKYYIGIDGGGTKSKCIIADENMNVLSETKGGPTNFLVIGTEQVCENLYDVIKKVCSDSKTEIKNLSGVVLGSTGAGRRPDAVLMENEFKSFFQSKEKIPLNFHVDSDARIALEGAFAGDNGSILIAGTGSIMFGKNNDGEIVRVGGFGRYIGDEGSGYTIGRKGLNVFSKQLDGRIDKSPLFEKLKSEFNFSDSATLINEVYKNNFDIARVARAVIETVDSDNNCLKIIEEQSNELIEHLNAMKKLTRLEILKVALIGSTITTENPYSQLFKQKASRLKNIKIVDVIYPPEVGAAVMAKNLF